MSETITAPPYTAQQCPACDEWFYVMDGPFAEGGDKTKPMSDFLHFEEHHPELLEQHGPHSVGIPFCTWNTEPVEATRR